MMSGEMKTFKNILIKLEFATDEKLNSSLVGVGVFQGSVLGPLLF